MRRNEVNISILLRRLLPPLRGPPPSRREAFVSNRLSAKSKFEATKKGADAPFSYKDLLTRIIVVNFGGTFKHGVVYVNFDIFPLFFTSGVVYCFKA